MGYKGRTLARRTTVRCAEKDIERGVPGSAEHSLRRKQVFALALKIHRRMEECAAHQSKGIVTQGPISHYRSLSLNQRW